MKKALKRLVAAALVAVMCMAVSGCGDNDSMVYMNYGVGVDEQGRYNTALYGLNGLNDPTGPDPGVFYVSEEEDPVYGGYFYRYHTSESTSIPSSAYYKDRFIKRLGAYCDRSKDLYHWEPAGALAGHYSLEIDQFDWCSHNVWAPEVIRNPADGKYYMYFSSTAYADLDIPYVPGYEDELTRFYIGVAVADAPTGPFDVIGDVDEETGILTSTINFMTGFDVSFSPAYIDSHLFFDDDGQLYLYCNSHPSVTEGNYYGGAIGMKMADMAHPDYSTVTPVLKHSKTTVTGTPGNLFEYEIGEDYGDEGYVNEGQFMLKHNGKYYLTYSAFGYNHAGYSVRQAVSDSPLGPFTKVTYGDGNPILDGSLFGDVYGTGHHSFVRAGDEIFILYHRHDSTIDGIVWDRPTAVDRITFTTNSEGLEVMTANGPSRILSWLPEAISGYKNLAQSADITVSNGTGVEYLTDSALTMYEVTRQKSLSVQEGDVVITLRWEQPVSVSSVMVYNSALPEAAFSQVKQMKFKLAEKPDWASKNYGWAVVEHVPIQHGAWDADSDNYLECAPAVAEFDPITVTEIQITLSEADRLVEYDINGDPLKGVEVSEIVVLGGAVTND